MRSCVPSSTQQAVSVASAAKSFEGTGKVLSCERWTASCTPTTPGTEGCQQRGVRARSEAQHGEVAQCRDHRGRRGGSGAGGGLRKGPVQKTGERVDRALDQDRVIGKGPVEKAGKKIDKAVDDVKR